MSRRRKLTRRKFLQISSLAVAGAVATACGQQTPEMTEEPAEEPTEPAPEEGSETEGKFGEAPMLAELVEQGELPPVDERLPLNPYIGEVAEGIGNYGGAIRRGFKGVSDRWGPTKHIDRFLVWYDRDLVLQPRLCESFELSDDAMTWTINLRKGMKWSDGTDFTSEAFQWYYENVAQNEDLSPSPPGGLSTRDEDGNKVLAEMEFPDDFTVVITFAHPNPMWHYGVARSINSYAVPGHHLAQFHMDLTDDQDALEAAIDEAGFNSWDEYFTDRNWWYLNRERPMFSPWLAANSLAEELFIMERNPYFFATDPEGNQLPYLDQVTHRLFDSNEVFNLWIVNGEIDFQNRHVNIGDYSLFKESEASGEYSVYLGQKGSHVAMQPNQTTKNEKVREFFQNRNARLAMSYAVNRDEMNELAYDGLLTPRQYSPLKLSPNYYPPLSEAHIEYNPDRAEELLDEAGYTEKNADGFRLWKDGSGPISFVMEGTAPPGSSDEDAAQLYTDYLKAVGINATYKYFERSLYTEHFQANELEAAWWGGGRSIIPLAPGAPTYRGVMIDRPWACAWGLWFNSNGTDPNGEEPPEDHFIWDIWDIWAQIEVEPDSQTRNEMFEGIMDIWAEELPMIGCLGEMPGVVIVKNGFHNYLEGMPIGDTTGDEHLLETETYYWENPEDHTL